MHKKFLCKNIPKEKSQEVAKKLEKIFTLQKPHRQVKYYLYEEFQ